MGPFLKALLNDVSLEWDRFLPYKFDQKKSEEDYILVFPIFDLQSSETVIPRYTPGFVAGTSSHVSQTYVACDEAKFEF